MTGRDLFSLLNHSTNKELDGEVVFDTGYTEVKIEKVEFNVKEDKITLK